MVVGRDIIKYMEADLVALGELSNFGAYAFSPAILVTPLTAVSVVVSAILSVVLLKEKMNFSASMGITLCIIGATLIVLHSPHTVSTETIPAFYAFVFSPGCVISFRVYCLQRVLRRASLLPGI